MAPNTGDSTLVDEKTSQLETSATSTTTDQQEEIWSSILKSTASSKFVPTKNVLILGDRGSGKSTLIKQFKGENHEEEILPNGVTAKTANNSNTKNNNEEAATNEVRQKNDLALSYTYIDIKDKDDEAEDTIARLGLYQLAGSQLAYHSLLRFVLNATTLPDSLVVIVLDWARPWAFAETLQRWIKILESAIESVKSEGPIPGSKDGWTQGKVVVDGLVESLERFIQNYTEPDSVNTNTNVPVGDPDVALPLGQGTLTKNLGIPLIVVCAKSDNLSNHERELEYTEEIFDFIQQSLRTICLKYGAGLFYTSVKQSQTFSDLRQYILHRLLGEKSSSSDTKSNYAFTKKAHVVERNTVRVPTGWDSWGKIKVLRDGFDCNSLLEGWDNDMLGVKSESIEGKNEEKNVSFLKEYDQVVFHEDSDKPSVQTMIVAEDEQAFFERHFETLQKGGSERFTSPSVVGPMGAATYAYTNIGGIDYGLEERLAKYRHNKDTTKATTQSTHDITTNGSIPVVTNGAAPPSQNEVIANFFHALLTKKASTNPPSGAPGSNQTSPNNSTINLPIITAKNPTPTTNVPSRKMVKDELDKMKSSNSQTVSAVGK
ncbi:4233_t:CDS:2 [Ambispora gerdemannii]|uniref:4233_t:CDS:1 n=1 Tax=Ambispora gerdemannii TaxID=144530 RepID=A0A9N8W8N4_9GLOM|nr:4233_t:CDS:2 [Ambispora gerdemannii]